MSTLLEPWLGTQARSNEAEMLVAAAQEQLVAIRDLEAAEGSAAEAVE